MKLFKKVAAAVLAGVMALSMVACGTTPGTNPGTDIPDPNPTLSNEDQFVQMVNEGIDMWVKNVAWTSGVTMTVPKFENKLKDKAAAILDAIAAGENTSAGKVTNYTLSKEDAKELMKDLKGVYVVNADGEPVKLESVGADGLGLKNANVTIKKGNNPFEYKTENAKAYIVGEYGLSTWFKAPKQTVVDGKLTAAALTYKYDLGIASKVINGQTCTIFVYADAE